MAAKQVVVCERHAPSRSWPARTTTQRLIDSRRQVRFASTSAATLHHGKVAFDQAQSSFRRSFKQAIFCALCVWRSACSHTRKAAISRKMVIIFCSASPELSVVHEKYLLLVPCQSIRTSGFTSFASSMAFGTLPCNSAQRASNRACISATSRSRAMPVSSQKDMAADAYPSNMR